MGRHFKQGKSYFILFYKKYEKQRKLPTDNTHSIIFKRKNEDKTWRDEKQRCKNTASKKTLRVVFSSHTSSSKIFKIPPLYDKNKGRQGQTAPQKPIGCDLSSIKRRSTQTMNYTNKNINLSALTKQAAIEITSNKKARRQLLVDSERRLKRVTKNFFNQCQSIHDNADSEFNIQAHDLDRLYHEVLHHWQKNKDFDGLGHTTKQVPLLMIYDFSDDFKFQLGGSQNIDDTVLKSNRPSSTAAPSIQNNDRDRNAQKKTEGQKNKIALIKYPGFLNGFLNYIRKYNDSHVAFQLYKVILRHYGLFNQNQLEDIFLCIEKILDQSSSYRHKELIELNKKTHILHKSILKSFYAHFTQELRQSLSNLNKQPVVSSKPDLKTSFQSHADEIKIKNQIQQASQSSDTVLSRKFYFSPIDQQGDLVQSMGEKLLGENADRIRKTDFSMLPLCLGFAANELGDLRCGKAWMKPLVEGLLEPFTVPQSTSYQPDHGLPKKTKEAICKFLIQHFGHPQLCQNDWKIIDEKYRQVLIRWQSALTLEQFFKVVDGIMKEQGKDEEKEQWQDRKKYWQQHMDQNDIHATWLCFGKAYEDRLSDTKTNKLNPQQVNLNYATINKTTGDPKHCVLLMETRQHILVEFSHNGALRAYSKNHPVYSRLKLFQTEYEADDLKNLKRGDDGWFWHYGRKKGSNGRTGDDGESDISDWQKDVDEYVFKGHRKRRRTF